jgi:hypothetical protein
VCVFTSNLLVFHIKAIDSNEVYILYCVQSLIREVIFEKIDTFLLQTHVKRRLCVTQTNQHLNSRQNVLCGSLILKLIRSVY